MLGSSALVKVLDLQPGNLDPTHPLANQAFGRLGPLTSNCLLNVGDADGSDGKEMNTAVVMLAR